MQTSTIARLKPPSSCRFILGTRIDVIDYAQAVRKIIDWAHQRYSSFICAANVHVVMEGFDSSGFREMINSADMVTPDGMPLVWLLRLRGFQASRVYGPDLMRLLLAACEEEGVSIGLYGASPRVLDPLVAAVPETE